MTSADFDLSVIEVDEIEAIQRSALSQHSCNTP
jgi:hypothetical protein